MDWTLLIYKTVFLFLILLVTLLVAMYSTYGERKVAAFMQDRRGPTAPALSACYSHWQMVLKCL